MKEVDANILEQIFLEERKDEPKFLFVYSAFCGTCHLARKMLEPVELTLYSPHFFEMNASLHPDFLYEHKIKSVPCLVIIKDGSVMETIYAFQSVTFLFEKLKSYS